MLSKKVKSRITFLIVFLVVGIIILFYLFKALEDNVVYFFSPTEIRNKSNISLDKKIRIGGLVKNNSVFKDEISTKFIITDLKNEIIVSYNGIVPNLFSEGKGVIAEGTLKDKKYLSAEKILAKHDENYMPPEVSNILEKSDK